MDGIGVVSLTHRVFRDNNWEGSVYKTQPGYETFSTEGYEWGISYKVDYEYFVFVKWLSSPDSCPVCRA